MKAFLAVTAIGVLVVSAEHLNTADSSHQPWTYLDYDVLGNQVKVTDPGGHVAESDYSDNFSDSTNRNSFAYPKRVTPPSGYYADTTYNFYTGLAVQTTDSYSPTARTTSTTYDLMNRPTAIDYPNGGYTHYTYYDNPANPLKVVKEVKVDNASTPNLGTLTTIFDKLYRETERQTNDPEGTIYAKTEYDDGGRKYRVSNPYRSGATPVYTEFAYDAMDRPTVTTAPDSSTVQYAYSGNQTTVTDEAGNQRRYTYNGSGGMTKVEEPNPTLTTPLITTYSYNELGKMTGSNQSSQTRSWAFDTLGRMTSQTLPESGTTSFTYDVENQLLTKTDARGITVTMTYGTSGGQIHQPVLRDYSDFTPDVAFAYNVYGLRTSMTDGLGSVAYTYDSKTDKLTQETRTLTDVTGTYSTGFDYNVKGDLTKLTNPSGRLVQFDYATGGGCCNSRLSGVSSIVSATTSTLANSMTFNAAGGLLTRTLNPGSNAVTEAFTYNNRFEVTEIKATKSSVDLMDITYNYGSSLTNTGRVLSRTDVIQPEHSAGYLYDSTYRLSQVTSADTSWGIAWTFDVWGNRLTQVPQGLAASANKVGFQTLSYEETSTGSGISKNRINLGCLSGSTPVSCFDAAGNQVDEGPGSGTHKYTFNAENQITQMDSGTAVYAYDGEGRRMKKTVGSETTYTFYGPGGVLCEFTTVSGASAAATTDRLQYSTSDKLGSAVLLLDSSGTVRENNRTLPYGEAWLTESTSSLNKKKFTSYERDSESNLDYALNRYYTNTVSRFLSVDKGSSDSWQPQVLNRYVYTANDPVNNTDPDGNYLSTAVIEAPKHPDPEVSRWLSERWGATPGELEVEQRAGPPIPMNKWETMMWQYGVSEGCAKGVVASNQDITGVMRASAESATLRLAADSFGVDWRLLAAIGVRESNFRNVTETDGKGLGVGVFQITSPAGSGISTDLMLAATAAAQLLSNAANVYPGIDRNSQLGLAIMARGFNTGPNNQYTAAKIAGGVEALDRGTAHPGNKGSGNYVSSVLGMMDCFKP